MNEQLVGLDDGATEGCVRRMRAIIGRLGGAVEQLGAQLEGTWYLATIHAKDSWPGRTIDVCGSGENYHAALADLEGHVQSPAP